MFKTRSRRDLPSHYLSSRGNGESAFPFISIALPLPQREDKKVLPISGQGHRLVLTSPETKG